MNTNNTLETDRLILKPTSEEDDEFVLELFNTPLWLKYIGDRNIHTIEDAREYIKTKHLPQFERLGFSNYTVIKKKGALKIGSCGLYDREGVEGIDIGFAFLPQYEGKGFAFEAASKLRDVAFHVFGINVLSAITVEENIASRRLLERLGLKLYGTTKLPDDETELLLYRKVLKLNN